MMLRSEILDQWKDVSSRELAAECRRGIEAQDDSEETASSAFYYRGGREEFEIGVEYCRSEDPLDRCTGAFLLEYLGNEGGEIFPFKAESLEVIVPMLDDPDSRVIFAALWALGRLHASEAVIDVLSFADHEDEEIRYAATFALGHMTAVGLEVTLALLKLAKDPDRDVRDWATFALGSLCEEDTQEIRQVLFAALSDPDREVVAEGLQGLANRGDPRAAGYLLDVFGKCEAEGDELADWWASFDPYTKILDTMTFLADRRFVPMLERLAPVLSGDADRALAACREGSEVESKPDSV